MRDDKTLLYRLLARASIIFGVLFVLTAAVPVVVLADTGEGPKPPPTEVSPVDMSPSFHPGDWTEVEPWSSLLREGTASPGLQLSTTALTPIFWYDDMESGVGSWTSTGTWALTEEWGGTNHSPTHSWSDSPGGDYLNDQDMTLYAPPMDLSPLASGGKHVRMIFNTKLDTEVPYLGSGGYVDTDYLLVQWTSDGGSTWDTGEMLYGEGEGYVLLDIPDGSRTCEFQIRFVFHSDYSYTYDGVYIDDLAVLVSADEVLAEDDARLTYLGEWSSGGGHNYTDLPGSAVVVNFSGTGLEWYGTIGPNYGLANISLDDGEPVQVDLYYPLTLFYYSSDPPVPVFSTWNQWGNLSDEAHTLVIWSSGEKSPSSSGYRLSIDELDVWGVATQSPATVDCEQDNADLEYFGAWSTVVDGSASGGTLVVVNDAGAVNVAFDGSYLAWFAKMGPTSGKAKVSLDGGPLQTVDLYYPWDSSQRRVYHTGPIADEPHTLSIYWSGENNSASLGTRIDADKFQVLGSFTDAGPADPLTWRFQQTDSRLTYLGSWTTSDTDWSASGGSYAGTGEAKAAAIAKFDGTEVTVLARTAPWYGQAEIYIDGVLEDTVDLYSSAVAYKVPVYTDDTLSVGEHTLAVVCKGTKNGSSTGTTISLDALDITGYLAQAPTITKVDDIDSSCVYAPDWSHWDDSGYWAAYEDTYAYTDKDGYKMSFTFEGTYAAWVACTSNTKGKAEVRLYSGSVDPGNLVSTTPVDLYSSSTLWKQQVYSTGILPDGAYIVVIECLYEKNPSSTWYTIDVDRFGILGTAIAGDPLPPVPLVYQQDNDKITYLGGRWSTNSSASASGGSYASTTQRGAAAVVKFAGTEVTPVFCTGPAYGEVRLTLDPGTAGEDVQTIDLYSATAGWKVTGLYAKTGLPDTVHTLVIENASTGGEPIGLDALDITGYIAQAQTVTKIDDKDYTHCSYDPGIASAGASTTAWSRWDASGYWAAYQDTYAYTDQLGHKVTFTFHGTYASWVACTSDTKGKAKVILDGDTAHPVTVDLYSPSTLWKQTVYSTGILPDGTHTIEIECLKTKNWASVWYTIDADRFDILATTP